MLVYCTGCTKEGNEATGILDVRLRRPEATGEN